MFKNTGNVLYLIPLPISEGDISLSIPLGVQDQVKQLQHFIVENIKTARHFIKKITVQPDWENLHFYELDKHHPDSNKSELLGLLKSGVSVGLMSEAGLPCIADPGNTIVRMAHDIGMQVKPLTGPSSILLALISSGLNGQDFRFNGYLPGKPEERRAAIARLEKLCRSSTQLFIEAPYRNQAMADDLLKVLGNDTRLLIASDIGSENEFIRCMPVSWWRNHRPELPKSPCMFGIG